jgi:hypothetical protein
MPTTDILFAWITGETANKIPTDNNIKKKYLTLFMKHLFTYYDYLQ